MERKATARGVENTGVVGPQLDDDGMSMGKLLL